MEGHQRNEVQRRTRGANEEAGAHVKNATGGREMGRFANELGPWTRGMKRGVRQRGRPCGVADATACPGELSASSSQPSLRQVLQRDLGAASSALQSSRQRGCSS